ncbi:MAG: DNA polymerase III subunit beta [Clostridiales bacterium]|nr:MAG: DNA polymerase III subunit beta [Clostridiales bacterium]
MRFTCNKEDIREAISRVIKTVPQKPYNSILECIHMTTIDGGVILRAYDTVTAIKTTISATVTDYGETAIPARLLSEIIIKLPDGEIDVNSVEGKGIVFTAGKSEATLQEMEADEFPEFPELKGDSIVLKQSELADMIKRTSFAVYQLPDKPIYTGMLVEAKDGEFAIVAVDGPRMAKKKIPFETVNEVRVVVPGKAMKEVGRLMENEDENVELLINENCCFFVFDDTIMYTQLLSGNFIDYRKLIPDDRVTRVRVETRFLEKSFEMMSVMAKEDIYNMIKIEITPDALLLTSKNDYGEISDSVPVLTEGDCMSIGFNVRYFLEAIRTIDDDYIFLDFKSKLDQCVIRPVEGDDYIYMIFPVNMK